MRTELDASVLPDRMEGPEGLLCHLARRLVSQPVAPYHEHQARSEAEQILKQAGLRSRRDKYGNLIVRLKTAPQLRPVVLAAHLDHPGFELVAPPSEPAAGAGEFFARFRGSVADSYFVEGTPVRLIPGGIKASLGKPTGEPKTFSLTVSGPEQIGVSSSANPRFAVWDLEDFALRDGIIFARSCDDLIGVACVLATLIELKRSNAAVNVIGVLSRAEEVGFQGALALAADGGIPQRSLVISLETSRELPGVRMGDGVIVRTGDRASTFDPDATRFLGELAAELAASKKDFCFQRALMSGGTCEATAYQHFGYQSTAVCVALGNYHNCGENNLISSEYVSLGDLESMVRLLSHAATGITEYERITGKLTLRLESLLKEARQNLPGTA